ncbi:unnamed protein product [Auanema sp. JU1783]|nr:unnamed protein product [Auanema sp. JU1783]
MMSYCRLSVLPKCLVYAAILYICASIFLTFFHSEHNVFTPKRYTFPEIPHLWQDYCQYLEHNVEGIEADFDNKTYRLRGLGIVFRHGERSPLVVHDESTVCKPYLEADRNLYEEYVKKIESDDIKTFIKADKKFADFPRFPDRSECRGGELTAEGALQHVRLGKYMQSKYGSSALFDPDFHLNVSITSSQYHRTYQSALAFSLSFLYPHRYNFPIIYIKASDFTNQCTHEACACPGIQNKRKQYEKEYTKVFSSSAPAYMRDTTYNLRQLNSFQHVNEPYEVLDVSLGSYICRRLPLPCPNDNVCLSYSFLNEVLNYTSSRGSYMFSPEISPLAYELQVIDSHGVLFHMRDMILRLKQFPHTNMLKIFSGHDVTIAPILRVLGVPFLDPPHYASRIAFEVLEHVRTKKLFLRVIYNGEDVTNKITFCTDLFDGLCSVEYLEDFVKKEIPQLLKAKSVSEFCIRKRE